MADASLPILDYSLMITLVIQAFLIPISPYFSVFTSTMLVLLSIMQEAYSFGYDIADRYEGSLVLFFHDMYRRLLPYEDAIFMPVERWLGMDCRGLGSTMQNGANPKGRVVLLQEKVTEMERQLRDSRTANEELTQTNVDLEHRIQVRDSLLDRYSGDRVRYNEEIVMKDYQLTKLDQDKERLRELVFDQQLVLDDCAIALEATKEREALRTEPKSMEEMLKVRCDTWDNAPSAPMSPQDTLKQLPTISSSSNVLKQKTTPKTISKKESPVKRLDTYVKARHNVDLDRMTMYPTEKAGVASGINCTEESEMSASDAHEEDWLVVNGEEMSTVDGEDTGYEASSESGIEDSEDNFVVHGCDKWGVFHA